MSTIQAHDTGTLLVEVVRSMAPSVEHRMAASANSVLLVLASSPYPLTRRDLSERIGVAVTTLSRSIIFLESRGLIVSTRRFGIVLGAHFLDNPELSRNLRDTTLAVARPRLEYFAQRHEGLSAIALSTEDSAVIAETAGTAPRGFDAEAFRAVLSGAVHTVHRDGTPAPFALRGVCAGAAGDDTVAIASRVRLTGSSAVLGIAVRTPTVAQFSDLSLAVLTEANVLTSALRRVYPTSHRSRVRSE